MICRKKNFSIYLINIGYVNMFHYTLKSARDIFIAYQSKRLLFYQFSSLIFNNSRAALCLIQVYFNITGCDLLRNEIFIIVLTFFIGIVKKSYSIYIEYHSWKYFEKIYKITNLFIRIYKNHHWLPITVIIIIYLVLFI